MKVAPMPGTQEKPPDYLEGKTGADSEPDFNDFYGFGYRPWHAAWMFHPEWKTRRSREIRLSLPPMG